VLIVGLTIHIESPNEERREDYEEFNAKKAQGNDLNKDNMREKSS
jgi:hypothetical protein